MVRTDPDKRQDEDQTCGKCITAAKNAAISAQVCNW
jgi:hypothetical protein